jgi:class 3 adenylate cyclase
VNIASRMESHGRPDCVQVSEVTKKLLEGKYDFEPMGLIEVKNAMPMPTYLLQRRRSA